MKSTLLYFLLLALLCSCEQESDLTQDAVPVIVDQENTEYKYQGVFSPTSGINGSGVVKIYFGDNQHKLVLENYSISNGPDLKVYLSKSNTPTDFVNLGNLNLAIVYSIPQSIDLKEYKFVLIHCQQYNHLFAVAELIQN